MQAGVRACLPRFSELYSASTAMKLFVLPLALAACAFAQNAPAPAPPPPIKSPEVHSDNTVTFRFRNSNAKEVFLAREGTQRVPMQKDDSGVWTITTDALVP